MKLRRDSRSKKPEVKRAGPAGAAKPDRGLRLDLLALQRLAGNRATSILVVQRTVLDPPQVLELFGPPPALTPDLVDAIVSDEVLAELQQFDNIAISVIVTPRIQPGFSPEIAGPPRPSPRVLTVNVHGVYFINTETAQEHYKNARAQSNFATIVKALKQRQSLIESGGQRYSTGRAVQLGKSTPDDIKQFVEEALSEGVVQRFARKHHMMTADQEFGDLEAGSVQSIIQQWITTTGVGVDCSGFVLQASIRAREAVRAEAEARGAEVPPEIGHEERSAASFGNGPAVTSPTDLRAGDAWVVGGGVHVRIVSGVRRESDHFEFDTAESSGTSTSPTPGQVERTWRTHSLAGFHPITWIGGAAGGHGGGHFHRVE